MRRFRFSLEHVLRVRRVEADLARLALAHANRAVRERDRQRAERAAVLAALAVGGAGGIATVRAFEAERARSALAAEALMDSETALREAAAVAAERRAAWLEATQRVSALERLAERRRQAFVIEERREEAAELADLVATRYRGDAR